MRDKHQIGMVMIETLIALIIFSLVAGALIVVSGQGINHQQLLRETYCANWLAENLLIELQLSPSSRIVGEKKGTSSQCDSLWQWHRVSQVTPDNRFFLINLEIYDANGQQKAKRQILRAR